MGVIDKNNRKIGGFGSESSESLHIPQNNEDDDAASGVSEISQATQPVAPPRRTRRGRRSRRGRRGTAPTPMSSGSPRRRLGKKRSRRYENVSQLETLVEDEELSEISINDFIPNSTGGFSTLFENNDALQVWEQFVNSSEDEQNQLIGMQKKAELKTTRQQSDLVESGEQAFSKISSGLRSKLRRCRVPLGIMEPLECKVVEFFSSSPTGTYISDVLTSFERLLLHAVAQYHGLVARSFNSNTDDSRLRLVKVSNSYETYQKPFVMLVSFLEEKRKILSK